MSEVRLIDANALKYKNLAEVNGRLTHVLTAEEIDNAPTVSPFKPMCKAKDEAICEEMTTDGHCNYSKPCPNKISQGDCSNCDFRKFSEKFVDNVVDLMNENGITSIEQLDEILRGGKEE